MNRRNATNFYTRGLFGAAICAAVLSSTPATAGIRFVTITFSPGEGIVGPGVLNDHNNYVTEYVSIENHPTDWRQRLHYPNISNGYWDLSDGFLDILGYRPFAVLSFDIDTDYAVELRNSGANAPLFVVNPDGIAGFQHFVVPAPIRIDRYFDAFRFNPVFSAGPPFKLDNIRLAIEVPEPSTWALLIAGFAAIGAAARRRKGARA